MPAFYLLGIIIIIAMWFLMAFIFKPLGTFLLKIYNDVKAIMLEDDNKEIK